MVVNGATKFGDMKHFDEHLAAFKAKGGDASYEYLHTQNLIALQVSMCGSCTCVRVALTAPLLSAPARLLAWLCFSAIAVAHANHVHVCAAG